MESTSDQFNKIYKENLSFADGCTFIVCAMLTPNNPKYFACADRLARSCEEHKLPYCLYEAANIHRSMSQKGSDDPNCTKAKFILFNMARFPGKNILYLDVDMFFIGYPEKIVKSSNEGYDFAVYNWLNDDHNEAYMPVSGRIEPGDRHSDFYIFSHSINFYCPEQLICSGGVQYYGNSAAARQLLEHWQTFVTSYPDFADDEGLDFVYNNFILHKARLKVHWLDKSCLRFPWWPHVKPVILHPEVPSPGRTCFITEIENRRRFYLEKCDKKPDNFVFPRDCLIDTKDKVLLRVVNNQIVDRRPIEQEFWIYSEKIGME